MAGRRGAQLAPRKSDDGCDGGVSEAGGQHVAADQAGAACENDSHDLPRLLLLARLLPDANFGLGAFWEGASNSLERPAGVAKRERKVSPF